jgi:phosphatidylglycerol:prolipoprotein diacylglycerol transferase
MPWLYQAIIALAIATGIILSRLTQRSASLTASQRLGIGVGAFVGAMLGAKLPFALADWNQLLSGGAWFSDGKTILTGLVGGYVGVVVAKWSLDIHVHTGDSFAMPVAASVAVGRLGCFVAGCCYGSVTTLPWGVVFPQHGSLPRHPTQLYEAAFHGLAALALGWLQSAGLFRGDLMKLYIIVYAGYRFLTEFIRDEQPLWLDLTGYQWASLVIILLFAGLWRRDVTHRSRPGISQPIA